MYNYTKFNYYWCFKMSTVALKKWGNSVGIRIPVELLRKGHLDSGAVLDISMDDNGVITLIPAQDKQAGWTEKFNVIADSELDSAPAHLDNEFDRDEWSW